MIIWEIKIFAMDLMPKGARYCRIYITDSVL